MSQKLGPEFKRLLAGTLSGDPRAPWWANWLLQIAIMFGVVWGGAFGVDWVYLNLFGQPAWAACGLLGLLPIRLLEPIGMVIGLVGLIAAMVGARAFGVAWLIIGVVVYVAPDLLASSGLGAGCPWVEFG